MAEFDVVATSVGDSEASLSDVETREIAELLADLFELVRVQLPNGVELVAVELELGRCDG